VALTLFSLFVLFVGVYLQGKLNEQSIRLTRYRHYEETLLYYLLKADAAE